LGTGYICCEKCNSDFTEEQLINSINNRRLRIEPFPSQNNEELNLDKIKNINYDEINILISDIINEVELFISLED